MSIVATPVGLEPADLPRMGWGLAPARGLHYRPADARPSVAFIAAHYNLDFSTHYLAEPLARRGFGFLGWDTRFCGREAWFRLDGALYDIDLGVQWLHEQGAERIVLLGNSGGGSLMAAYQARFAGRVRASEGERAGGGDLYVSVAAHPGRPEVLTNWLDPAVTDETDPTVSDPELDMYDPANGPPYESDFVRRYREAQRERNQRITEWCEGELERLAEKGYGDRLFTVSRTWADLRFLDPALDPSDRPTPACYRGDPARANRGTDGIGNVTTLRTWLEMWSLARSPCRAAEHLAGIDAPALVVQPTGDVGVFPSDARAIFDALPGPDKTLRELPGDHYFRGPGDPRQELADLLAEWVSKR